MLQREWAHASYGLATRRVTAAIRHETLTPSAGLKGVCNAKETSIFRRQVLRARHTFDGEHLSSGTKLSTIHLDEECWKDLQACERRGKLMRQKDSLTSRLL